MAADANAIVSIAKETGFSISAGDLNTAQLEISDEELESMAGGNLSFDSHCKHDFWNGLCPHAERRGTNVNIRADHVCQTQATSIVLIHHHSISHRRLPRESSGLSRTLIRFK